MTLGLKRDASSSLLGDSGVCDPPPNADLLPSWPFLALESPVRDVICMSKLYIAVTTNPCASLRMGWSSNLSVVHEERVGKSVISWHWRRPNSLIFRYSTFPHEQAWWNDTDWHVICYMTDRCITNDSQNVICECCRVPVTGVLVIMQLKGGFKSVS